MSPTKSADPRARILRAITNAPLAVPPPNAVAFVPGVAAERAELLRIIEQHDALGDPLVSRQAAVLRGIVIDLSEDLLAHGRRTEPELTYPNDADGGARLLRDEVIAALGSRTRAPGSPSAS